MSTLEEIVNKLNPKVDKLTRDILRKFGQNFISIYRQEAVLEIKAALMKAYDELVDIEEGEMGPRVRGKDPLSLKNLRGLFEEQITQELYNNVSIEGDELHIQVMDKSKLGFGLSEPPEGPPSTIDVLSYYLVGFVGEYAFITPEQYEARGRKSSRGLGRLGGGFLMPKSRYKSELWEERTGIPFEDVRHSISGQEPYGGFQQALDSIDFSKYISKAVELTTSSLPSSI